LDISFLHGEYVSVTYNIDGELVETIK